MRAPWVRTASLTDWAALVESLMVCLVNGRTLRAAGRFERNEAVHARAQLASSSQTHSTLYGIFDWPDRNNKAVCPNGGNVPPRHLCRPTSSNLIRSCSKLVKASHRRFLQRRFDVHDRPTLLLHLRLSSRDSAQRSLTLGFPVLPLFPVLPRCPDGSCVLATADDRSLSLFPL